MIDANKNNDRKNTITPNDLESVSEKYFHEWGKTIFWMSCCNFMGRKRVALGRERTENYKTI